REAPETPRRVDLGALAPVRLDRLLGPLPRLRPLAAVEQQARQHHDVERVVAAGPRLRTDRLARHRDRAIEVVGVAGEAERAAVGALLLPRARRVRDQPKPALDLGLAGRPDEPELARRAEEQRVRA